MGGRHPGTSAKLHEELKQQMREQPWSLNGGKSTNVEHTKPLTYESSNDEDYSNLYKVSGGRRIRKSLSKNVKSRRYSKNKRKSKRRLSRKKRGGSKRRLTHG